MKSMFVVCTWNMWTDEGLTDLCRLIMYVILNEPYEQRRELHRTSYCRFVLHHHENETRQKRQHTVSRVGLYLFIICSITFFSAVVLLKSTCLYLHSKGTSCKINT